MSVIKGILTYTLIFIGLIIGVGVILVGIMYFFPGVSIFGYKFYHGNDKGTIYEVVSSAEQQSNKNGIVYIDKGITDDIDAIEIVASNYNVEVKVFKGVEGAAQSFRVEFTKSLTGFVSKNSNGPWFTVEAKKKLLTGENDEKNVVTFTAHEPKGFYMNRNAHMTVWIADNLAGGTLNDLRIESGRGSVKFEQGFFAELDKTGDPTLNVNNLAIKDKANTLDIKHVNILKSLAIDADSSNLTIDRALACDVRLNCKKGKFKFGDIERNNPLTNTKVQVDAVNADVQFGNVDADVHLTSDYGLFRAGTITGSFTSLGHNVVDNNNACDIIINKIEGITIIQNDSGKVTIGQVGLVGRESSSTDLCIDTKSGNVTITNCFAKLVEITSKRGAIKLGNALCQAKVETTYGAVNIEFMADGTKIEGVADDDIEVAIENLKSKTLIVSTGVDNGDGTITVKNVRGQATLKSGGSGKIIAHFLNVTGDNSVESSRGNVEVVVPQVVKTAVTGGYCTGFWLNWEAKNADVKVGNFISTKAKATTEEKYNKTAEAVYVGAEFEDESNPTKMTVKSNNRALIYDVGHYAI